jgi:plasmid maintenance system killer protein
MIKSFHNKGLKDYFYTGSKRGIKPEHANRLGRMLDRLDASLSPKDMDLPGYAKEDVQAELKDGYMTITAEHTNQNEEKNTEGKVIRRERYQGICRRSFYVGDAVTEKDIQAKFKDGVLTLQVPKKEKEPEVENKKYIAIE